jgi:hypothetical protein
LEGLATEDVGIFYSFYGKMVYFMAIWYILWLICIFLPFWYILLRCITKNLATLFSLQNGDKKDEPELVVIPAAAKPAESGPPRRSMLEDSDEDEDESEEEEVSPQAKKSNQVK